jgi:hypothetical protein
MGNLGLEWSSEEQDGLGMKDGQERSAGWRRHGTKISHSLVFVLKENVSVIYQTQHGSYFRRDDTN